MPTLSGMKPAGYYDRNSSFQQVTMEAVIGWVTEAVPSMPLPDEPHLITLADFGCSEGNNSIVAMGHIVEALRARRPAQPLCVVHCDLPGNNFNQLFLNLHDPARSNYLQSQGRVHSNTFAFARGGSFFDILLPAQSLSVATSFLAVEWLDHLPDIPMPEFIGYMEAPPAAQAAFARQADDDLTRFLAARATELAPGGKLLLIIPGSDNGRSCSDGLYNVLNDAARDLAESGRITQNRYEKFVMPVYFRSLAELTAPLTRASSPVRDAFSIDRAETLIPPTPFEDDFRRTGDTEAYATAFAGFLRAFSEPVAAACLLAPGEDRTIIEELYDRIHARLVAEPTRYTVRNIEVALLLTRR